MVSLSDVLASNAQIPSSLPKQLVAIFAGATSGIGEVTLKTFVKYAVEPRIYLFARSQASAERVIAECRRINPGGDYVFVQVDLSLIKETDHACEQVKRKEKLVNLMVLSAGEAKFGSNLTPEGLNVFMAASAYSRFRIAQQLLPLLITAASTTPLARVVDVAGGTYEGHVDTSDIPALNVSYTKLRPHTCSIHTLSLEALAQQAPTVSFVHEFPDAVYTNLHKDASGALGLLFRVVITMLHAILGGWIFVPLEESGERHVFFATSRKYKPLDGGASGVSFGGLETAEGSNSVIGSGVYSMNWDGEKRTEQSVIALKELRSKRVNEMVWNHITSEFDRITGEDQPIR